jgi:hypothetical protein
MCGRTLELAVRTAGADVAVRRRLVSIRLRQGLRQERKLPNCGHSRLGGWCSLLNAFKMSEGIDPNVRVKRWLRQVPRA